jgi:signal transduction histidine kinase
MKRIWKFVSYLGLDSKKGSLNEQVVILGNRINFLLLVFTLTIFIILRIQNLFDHGTIGMGSLGSILLFFLTSFNLFLSFRNKSFASRILIIILGPFLSIVLPILLGYVREESFVYNPYVLITFSTLIPLLILPAENKFLFWFSFLYYFTLVLSIDWLMSVFATNKYLIVDRIETFLLWNKLAHIGIFIFINLCVLYLRNLTLRFENELKNKNTKLDQQNEELKVMLEELKLNQQHLIHSEKMASLGTLTAGVAHEINNPLNFISGGLNIIEDLRTNENLYKYPEVQDELRASSETIQAGLDRATKIVRSLIAFAYSGKPLLAPADVHEIIDNTLLFLNSKFEFKVEIEKNYLLKKRVPVYIDLLHQIILNILDNAVFELIKDTSGTPKLITIKTFEEEFENSNYAFISIYNSGPQIPEANFARLFDPFFTTKMPGEGTGLGLSIAFTLVKKHNGSISVQNLPEGVEFLLKLPLNSTIE